MCCNCCEQYKYVFIKNVVLNNYGRLKYAYSSQLLYYINKNICPTYKATYPTLERGRHLAIEQFKNKLKSFCPMWLDCSVLEDAAFCTCWLSYDQLDNAETQQKMIAKAKKIVLAKISKEYDVKIAEWEKEIANKKSLIDMWKRNKAQKIEQLV